MPIQVQLTGQKGQIVEVTPRGQLVVAPLTYSTGRFNNMDVIDTAYNFYEPIPGKRFVMTGFIVATNRNVGVNGAVIIFYEADAVDSLTVDETILQLDMVKNDVLPIVGLNFILSEGAFLNGKTDDDDVLATIMGYEIGA